MSKTESRKIDEMRRLALRLREYSARRSFADHAQNMAMVAEELDQCADKAEARGAAFQ
jgi:DNA-binding Lrp family transcriptional regulator